MPTAKRVAVTGAAGQISYNLLFSIANGDLFGPDQPVILQLLEIPPAMDALGGVALELEDCASPVLADIVLSDDPKVAFKDASWALLVGSKPRGPGMERGDLIRENGPIFTTQGQALESVGASDLQVLVVGNPCNTNCLIAMHNAPGVPRERWHAMTRLDHNRAIAQLAGKTSRPVADITNMTIWGNHSTTQYPDFVNAKIGGEPAESVVGDRDWLEGDFQSRVQKRGAEVINGAWQVVGGIGGQRRKGSRAHVPLRDRERRLDLGGGVFGRQLRCPRGADQLIPSSRCGRQVGDRSRPRHRRVFSRQD